MTLKNDGIARVNLCASKKSLPNPDMMHLLAFVCVFI